MEIWKWGHDDLDKKPSEAPQEVKELDSIEEFPEDDIIADDTE